MEEKSFQRRRIREIFAQEKIEDTIYLPISQSWWKTWNLWIDNKIDKAPAAPPVCSISSNCVWLPANIVRELYRFNSLEIPLFPKARRVSQSRWSFSWDYCKTGCCSCCGSSGAQYRCKLCKHARYCNIKCQQIHWDYNHKRFCRDFESDIAIEKPCERKRTGLLNLGNSCFMNATIQCLISARPLLKYFLRDEWMLDLRPQHRNMAVSFADLCKNITFSEIDYVSPSQVKKAVSKLSTGLFAGYQQNDAEELLLFLLDTLHEDLDVIKDKGVAPREDEDQWEAHRRRERSIIDHYMLGSYETSTTCTKCGHVSLKTDVFKHLNLALPPNSPQRVIVVVVVRQPKLRMKDLPQRAFQTRYAALAKKDDTCESFQKIIASSAKLNIDNLWFVTVENGIVIRELFPSHSLKKVPTMSNDTFVVAYETGINQKKVNSEEKFEETKTETDDDERHLICMFSRGKTIDNVIPICLTFSSSKDTVSTVMLRLKESAHRVLDDTTAGLNFFSTDRAGMKERKILHDNISPDQLFVDYLTNEDFKAGRSRVEFILCVREKTSPPIKMELTDHKTFTDLKTELQGESKGDSVLSCLRHFVEPSTLDEENCWKCGKCSKMSSANQIIRFSRFPRILILVLKRFNIFEGKITSLVKFDVENMDLSEFVENSEYIYDLFAVVNHYGSMVGGHYTAFVGGNLSDTTPAEYWDEIDDSKCMDITKNYVVSSAAYILFYRRRAN